MLKKIKFNISSFFVVLFLSFLMGCNSFNKEKESKKTEYSGEELFAAIYFGVGDFSKEVIQFNNRKIEKDIQLKIHQLINEIQLKDSLFFRNFKSNIKSSNRVLMRHEIRKGNKKIQKHRPIFYPKRKNNLTDLEIVYYNLLDVNLTTNKYREHRKLIELLSTDLLIDKIAKYYENSL